MPVLPGHNHTRQKRVTRYRFHLRDRPVQEFIRNGGHRVEQEGECVFGRVCIGVEGFELVELGCVDEVCKGVFEDNCDVCEV